MGRVYPTLVRVSAGAPASAALQRRWRFVQMKKPKLTLIPIISTDLPPNTSSVGPTSAWKLTKGDLLGVPVVRPRVTETTALGAAYLAGLATGFWAGPDELRAKREGDVRFEPRMDAKERAERRGRWQRAVERSKSWSE